MLKKVPLSWQPRSREEAFPWIPIVAGLAFKSGLTPSEHPLALSGSPVNRSLQTQIVSPALSPLKTSCLHSAFGPHYKRNTKCHFFGKISGFIVYFSYLNSWARTLLTFTLVIASTSHNDTTRILIHILLKTQWIWCPRSIFSSSF